MADLARLFDFVNGTVIDAEQVDAEFNQLIARINALEPDSLNQTLAEYLGVSQTGAPRRGRAETATAEAASAIALANAQPTAAQLASLPTPDKVPGVVVPAGALVIVDYFARVEFVSTAAAKNTGWTSLLVGGNFLKSATAGSSGVPWVSAGPGQGFRSDAGIGTLAGQAYSSPIGVMAATAPGGGGLTGSEAATGSVSYGNSGDNVTASGLTIIRGLAAGTYDFEVKYVRDSSNCSSMTVRERHLHVWVNY